MSAEKRSILAEKRPFQLKKSTKSSVKSSVLRMSGQMPILFNSHGLNELKEIIAPLLVQIGGGRGDKPLGTGQ
jgi:hypothetical protein